MKRTWTFGITGILLTLVLFGYNVTLQKRLILRDSQAAILNLINSVEMDLERSFIALEQVFLGFKNYLDTKNIHAAADEPAINRIISVLLQNNPYLTALMVLDADGQVLHWNNNLQKPNLEQRDYFKVHLTEKLDRLFIGEPQESIINKGQWIFGISKAIRDDRGELKLVLAAIVDVKYLYRQYEPLFNQGNNRLTISSSQGNIYSQIPGHEQFAGKKDPHIDRKLHFAATTSEVQFHATPSGEKHAAAIRKIVDFPLVISVTQDEETMLASWQVNFWIYTLLGGLLSLALLFLTYRTASYQRQQLASKEELRLQAVTDPLTKLMNRRFILEQTNVEMKKAQRSQSPLSLILLDLDFFKRINDRFGRLGGDIVLEGIAELLKNNCRESDIVSRFGGEEFLLLLPATDLAGAITEAEKIRKALENNMFQLPEGEVGITASLGVTQWGEDETSTSAVLRRADSALYEAKMGGRNRANWVSSDGQTAPEQSKDIWLH